MVDNDILEIGTDINRDWSFNSDGDLNLVSGNDNIIQTIQNRLNTDYDSIVFYDGYGSFLSKFYSWRRNPETLDYMEKEVRNSILKDPRFTDITVELEYGAKGTVNGYITIVYDDETDLTLSLVLDNMEAEVKEV